MTGSMEYYVNKLKHYAGELPLLTTNYGASETNVNPKLPPELAIYTVLPRLGYYEFIPLSQSQQNNGWSTFPCVVPQPVGLTEVKVGEEYEIVTTNPTDCSLFLQFLIQFTSLYRYRLGDVVKVMGFYNSTLELKFVRRSNVLLSINVDKTTEKDLQIAVEAATKLLGGEKLEVVDYTSHADVSSDPGHCVIFWEINGEASEELLTECCNCLENSLVNPGYTTFRKTNSIGPLQLRFVRRGTFQKILDHILGLGATGNQYKIPRCVGPTHSEVLQILSENVVQSYVLLTDEITVGNTTV